MAKIRVNNRSERIRFGTELSIELKKPISKAIKLVLARRNMAKFMVKLANTMRVRTRLGFNALRSGGNRIKIKKNLPSTVNRRKAIKKKGGMSNLTTPARSNLTLSGKMLNAMRGFGRAFGLGEVRILNKSRPDSKATNKEIAGFQENKGRPFLNLTKKEIKELGQDIKKQLVKQLRK